MMVECGLWPHVFVAAKGAARRIENNLQRVPSRGKENGEIESVETKGKHRTDIGGTE